MSQDSSEGQIIGDSSSPMRSSGGGSNSRLNMLRAQRNLKQYKQVLTFIIEHEGGPFCSPEDIFNYLLPCQAILDSKKQNLAIESYQIA